MAKTDLHPAMNALVTRRGGHLTAAVLNTTGEEVIVRAGTRYGTLERLDTAKEGLHSIERTESQARKMADQTKEAAKLLKGVGAPLPRTPKECTQKEREAWLMQQFKLDTSPFLSQPEDLRMALDLSLIHI